MKWIVLLLLFSKIHFLLALEKSCNTLRDICVVGEGATLDLARNNARKEMALYFQSHIQSAQKVSSKSQHEVSERGFKGQSSEDISDELSVATDQILEGIQIKEQSSDQGKVVVFATLDKKILAERLQQKMDELDLQMKELLKEERNASPVKLQRMYDLREGLSAEFHLLNKKFYPKKINLEEVFSQKSKQNKEHLTFYLDLSREGELGSWIPKIRQIMNHRHWVLLSDEAKANFLVHGDLSERQEFMKVSGFEKYTFNLELIFENNRSKEQISINKEFTATGRDRRQVAEKLRKEIDSFLDEEINQLELKI